MKKKVAKKRPVDNSSRSGIRNATIEKVSMAKPDPSNPRCLLKGTNRIARGGNSTNGNLHGQ